MCQFSVKIDNIWFFHLNLRKLPNYLQYFGSNIVEGVAESWVEVDEAGWRWMHSLVIPFDDIFKNLSLVVSYTQVMLHSHWYYWTSSCTRDIPGTRFHLIPFLEVEILVGGGGCAKVYSPLSPTSHIPCILMNNTCSQAVCPVMLLSWPAAWWKVIFRTTCFAYPVFASKFWNAKMNIPRMYLTASSKWL